MNVLVALIAPGLTVGLVWTAKLLLSRHRLRTERRALGPPELHLVPQPPSGLGEPEFSQAAVDLRSLGFEEAGCFGLQEMPGAQVRILVDLVTGVSANLHVQPGAGCWAEFVTWYQDGTTACFTTSQEIWQKAHARNLRVQAPGASLAQLYSRIVRERPAKLIRPLSKSTAASDYMQRYADERR